MRVGWSGIGPERTGMGVDRGSGGVGDGIWYERGESKEMWRWGRNWVGWVQDLRGSRMGSAWDPGGIYVRSTCVRSAWRLRGICVRLGWDRRGIYLQTPGLETPLLLSWRMPGIQLMHRLLLRLPS